MNLALFLPEWVNGFNFLIGLLIFIVTLAAAWVLITARKGTDVATLQVDRANAAEAILKLREGEILALKTELADTEEELEGVTAEHRTVVGVKMKELMDFWATKERLEAEMADLRREIRILQMRKDGDTK